LAIAKPNTSQLESRSNQTSESMHMSTTSGPSPGAVRHPHYKLNIHTSNRSWRVRLDGRTLAASDKALVVEENGYEPVTYFPLQDVNIDVMQQSDSRTSCPFKGQADYFAASVDGKQKDIAWVYPSVYNEVESIAGYIAFYADRVEIESMEAT